MRRARHDGLDRRLFPFCPQTSASKRRHERCNTYGLGDGLPLVPPTSQRLRSMLAAVTDSQWSAGLMPPLFGDLRVAAVAYQCVLAGCEPAHLPIVMAAAQAVLAPEFNLLGVLTTTGTPAVAVVVHGPIAAALGVRGDGNCLGPGAGANACIGRALSLVMRNIGGAREGIGDMATMGQPAKYTLCFGESPDATIPSVSSAPRFERHARCSHGDGDLGHRRDSAGGGR